MPLPDASGAARELQVLPEQSEGQGRPVFMQEYG